MVVAEVCSSMKYPKRCQYKHAKQKKYHVRNWAEYNEGLRRRGDLTVWFDEEAIANWKADKTGKRGGQRVYSDMAIETGLVVRMVYKLAYRQTEGFLHSIASLLGLGIEIPDYSTLCRRSRLLRKKLRIPKAASTQPIHLMIDSTGLRIHVGNARKPPKLRAWRKLHIAVDRETGNIVASELTASRAREATRVPALLTQIQAPLVSVAADSAYDKEAVYEAIEAHSPGRRTRVVIPPQRNATLSQNSNTAMQERDRHIRAIESRDASVATQSRSLLYSPPEARRVCVHSQIDRSVMRVFLIHIRDPQFYALPSTTAARNGNIRVMGFPPIGIMSLSAVLKRDGHECVMFDQANPETPNEVILEEIPTAAAGAGGLELSEHHQLPLCEIAPPADSSDR